MNTKLTSAIVAMTIAFAIGQSAAAQATTQSQVTTQSQAMTQLQASNQPQAALSQAKTAQLQNQLPAGFSGLDFGSFRITSIVPTSFTSIDGAVTLTVEANPYGKVTVTDISGLIYKHGTPFIIGKADDMVIPAGKGSINVQGHISLASTEALMAVLRDPSINPADYSADVKATVKVKGRTMIIEKQNMPLSRILKR